MKKIILISTALGASVLALGTFGAIANTAPCNYNEKGQWVSNGQVHAWGPMEGARACAEKGLLPQVVLNRLGVWGDAVTRAEAQVIKDLDARIKAEKKAAAEAAKAKEEQK